MTKESKIKLKLEYGNPSISRAEIKDDKILIEILIPGVVDKAMVVVADYNKIMIEHEIDERFVDKFKFFLIPTDQIFAVPTCYKSNGVFYLEAEIFNAKEVGSQTILV